MSGLVRRSEDVPAGTVALVCTYCGVVHLLATLGDVQDLGDPLCCTECRRSGLIPRRQLAATAAKVINRWPSILGPRGWTPAPNALLQLPADVVNANARIVIIALESFRFDPDEQWVWPGQELLAKRAGLGLGALQRTLAELRDRQWLVMERRRRAGGTWDLYHYSLAPFWIWLADNLPAKDYTSKQRVVDEVNSAEISSEQNATEEAPANEPHVNPPHGETTYEEDEDFMKKTPLDHGPKARVRWPDGGEAA